MNDTMFSYFIATLEKIYSQLENENADMRAGIDLAINLARVYESVERMFNKKDGD